MRNNFGVCFVAGSDTRLGVVFYTVGSVSHRVAPTHKILLAKLYGIILTITSEWHRLIKIAVVFYSFIFFARHSSSLPKILLAKPCGMVLVYALSDFIHLGVDFIFICGSSPEGRAFQRKVKYSKIYCFFSYFMLIYLQWRSITLRKMCSRSTKFV